MFCEFTAYCDKDWNINTASLGAIQEVLPDSDWVTHSAMGDTDDDGNEFMCYSIGEDLFTNEDGEKLEGFALALEMAEKYNELEMLESYVALYPLIDSEHILDLWLNCGGQNAERPGVERVKSEIEKIKTNLNND